MPEAFHHFAQLFLRVFVCSYTFLGTTPGGLAAQIVSIVGTEVRGGWWKLSAWKANWRGGLNRAIGALLFVWVITFIVCGVTTLYNDHRNVVGRLREVVNEKDNLKTLLNQRDQYIKRLEGRTERPQCWMDNYYYRNTDEAHSRMTMAMVHCNRDFIAKQESPLSIVVEFNKVLPNQRLSPTWILGPGSIVSGGMSSHTEVISGNAVRIVMTMAYIPAHSIVAVTIVGGDEFLQAIGGRFDGVPIQGEKRLQ